jgi:hypothetical protein
MLKLRGRAANANQLHHSAATVAVNNDDGALSQRDGDLRPKPHGPWPKASHWRTVVNVALHFHQKSK